MDTRLVTDLYRLFRFLVKPLGDDGDVQGKIELDANGGGELLLVERKVGEITYPKWATPQRLQSKWSTLEEGIRLLEELRHKANIMEIKVTVSSGIWKNTDEQNIVERIAVVCVGNKDGVRLKGETEGGYKWHLHDSSNNWWASELVPENEDKVICVAFRYGTADMMLALQTFLNWVFKK